MRQGVWGTAPWWACPRAIPPITVPALSMIALCAGCSISRGASGRLRSHSAPPRGARSALARPSLVLAKQTAVGAGLCARVWRGVHAAVEPPRRRPRYEDEGRGERSEPLIH